MRLPSVARKSLFHFQVAIASLGLPDLAMVGPRVHGAAGTLEG
jgi:hypothetical protein